MLDSANMLEKIKQDNRNIYRELVTQLSIHSDSHPRLISAVEDVHIQMNNLTMFIEHFLSKGGKNGHF